MVTSTTRKVGNSIMISIPKELHPKKGEEYLFHKTESGAIIMAPRIKNPFKSNEKFEPAKDNEIFEKQAMKDWNNE